MMLGILKRGDHVINVTSEFVALERQGGEVDIIPIIQIDGSYRVDTENIITIGYGDNTVQTQDGDVIITTF